MIVVPFARLDEIVIAVVKVGAYRASRIATETHPDHNAAAT
ncbi:MULTISPECIES: hypothetical protein [Nonomuraea]|uniref:Uncharacterized protein n=1 Tax=Nonomuraea salmonea TaxID=46181 RepID=A0ABV5NMU6_9ACTN